MAFLVRIKPHLPVSSYNEFFKDKGWAKVSEEKAEWCRTRRINDHNPDAEFVFEVKTTDEAKAVVAAEQKVSAPAGTPDAPIDMTGGAAGESGAPSGSGGDTPPAGDASADAGDAKQPKLRRS